MVTFRPVKTDEEIEETAGLAALIWKDHYTPIIGEEQVEYMLEKFQSPSAIKQAIASGYRYYIITEADKSLGYIGVVEDDGLFLSKIYLKSEARGRGLARRGIDFLKDYCRENQIDKIWLTCNIHNDNTLAAYKKMGFEITSTQQVDIGGGYIMDDNILTLKL